MRNNDFDVLKNHIFLRNNGRGRHNGAKRHQTSKPDQNVRQLGDWANLLSQPLL